MRRLFFISMLAVAAGCSTQGSDTAPDIKPKDAGTDVADASAPPDASADAAPCVGPTGCNGICERGNSRGVGRYCTGGGGQCASTPDQLAPFCTQDFNPTNLGFCTRPCADDSQCGENARCTSENGSGPKGCFPDFCMAEPSDAGPDAGLDAGMDAGPDAGLDAGPDAGMDAEAGP